MQVIAQKYEIIRELGTGGYGKVYLVRHVDLGIKLALKTISQSGPEDGQFLDRFKREAEILSRFSHPRSAQLRDFGKTNEGLYYMALDYCEGTLLEEFISKSGPSSCRTALEIASQVLEVLEAAHRIGIVHRDIKPSNIMLSEEKGHLSVKILDFGIAKLKQVEGHDLSVTRDGAAIGTPLYMSPEQASGQEDIDNRADIYSTGVVLYELLCGKPPFQATSVLQTLLKHLTQPPPRFGRELEIPKQVENVVSKALAKEVEQRYQSAEEFRDACLGAMLALADSEKPCNLAQILKSEAQHLDPLIPKPIIAPVAPQSAPIQPELITPPAIESSKVETKILCLDDNEMVLNILRHLLEREKFQVFTAQNFAVIHDYIFREKIKIMLCDVQMPGLPGTKICKMLKMTVPKLKIILFSNIPDRELEKAATDSKADSWLSKNSKPEAWVAKIREVMGESGQKTP